MLRRKNSRVRMLDDLRRIAGRDRVIGHVLRHDGGSTADRAFSG